MFTIRTTRAGTCDDCCVHSNGVEFVLEQDPGHSAFLCWRHFRMTLEAMRVASLCAEGARDALQLCVDTEAIRPVSEPALRTDHTHTACPPPGNGESTRQNYLHVEEKGGTDRRDTGGEG